MIGLQNVTRLDTRAPHTWTKHKYTKSKKPINMDDEISQGWTQEHHLLGLKIYTITVRNPQAWTMKSHKDGHNSTTNLD